MIINEPISKEEKGGKNSPRQELKKVVKNHWLNPWKLLKQYLLSIPKEEASFDRRGFKADTVKTKQQLEKIGETFLEGYHAAITVESQNLVLAKLTSIEKDLQGFAFEGAAMALALLDRLTPWKSDRLSQFLSGAGNHHIYMAYVGAGWALARFPWTLKAYLHQLDLAKTSNPDPLLGWLAIDGYGFHQGYFHKPKHIDRMVIPTQLSGYSLNVFDQGLGRSLWFVEGANIPRIAQTIQTFAPQRRGDLWSGIGLACTYAGGVDEQAIKSLKILGEAYLPQIAQGAAFAAKTRQRAGNLTEHTQKACQILCGMSAEEAAAITDQSLMGLSYQETTPAYKIWRERIQSQFVTAEVFS